MKRPQSPEQRAAMDRAKKAPTHPWRAWRGDDAKPERDQQRIVPYSGRLVRK